MGFEDNKVACKVEWPAGPRRGEVGPAQGARPRLRRPRKMDGNALERANHAGSRLWSGVQRRDVVRSGPPRLPGRDSEGCGREVNTEEERGTRHAIIVIQRVLSSFLFCWFRFRRLRSRGRSRPRHVVAPRATTPGHDPTWAAVFSDPYNPRPFPRSRGGPPRSWQAAPRQPPQKKQRRKLGAAFQPW